MIKYSVDPKTAAYSDSIEFTVTTVTNHADNINQAPKQLMANTADNHRRIIAIENRKVQAVYDTTDGGLNFIVKED